MNPFSHDEKPSYFGKEFFQGFIGSGRKSLKPSSYSRMKTKQIEKRRQKNKMGYKSRRHNRIISNTLHCKFFPI
jgi:hypothetical protein